jgi:hypothetical protein
MKWGVYDNKASKFLLLWLMKNWDALLKLEVMQLQAV